MTRFVLLRIAFTRGLALVYLVAFLSLGLQVRGLLGASGIAPAGELLESVRREAASRDLGVSVFLAVPTLFWLDASDASLVAACVLGVVLSVLLLAGLAPPVTLGLLWLLYLSIVVVGSDFLHFQWDTLLLETGLVAILLGPWRLRSTLADDPEPWEGSVWLVRWLAFRLVFSSGIVKLLSGDRTWRDGTALLYHYQTQPLPTPLGWWVHHFPAWLHVLACLVMYAIEILAPFLLFAPRRARAWAASALVAFQLAIAATGNYGFFNLLTLVLCLSYADDAALARWLPRRLHPGARPAAPPRPWLRRAHAAAVMLMALVATAAFALGLDLDPPKPAMAVLRALAPLRSFNSYGLFRVMTVKRPEIVIEGSDDGVAWRAYDFRHKPGPVGRRPRLCAPHHPRLDWQMWFAALGEVRGNPWFVSLVRHLLQGTPAVRALLRDDPFPDRPPRYVRALLYEYRFTTLEEKRATGDWWSRTELGLYCPPVALR